MDMKKIEPMLTANKATKLLTKKVNELVETVNKLQIEIEKLKAPL